MIEIIGAPGYYISEDGTVIGMKGRPIKCSLNKKGYKVLRMPNVDYSKCIHRIVAIHFISNPENKPQVNHIDGNKLNNHVSNLEWATAKENINHAIKIGLRTAKSNCRGNNIFDSIQVKVIKDALKNGFKGRSIATYFNCHESTISKINVGKHYPNL